MNGKGHSSFWLLNTVNGFAYHIEKASLNVITDWHFNWRPGVGHFHSSSEAFSSLHRDGSDALLAKMLLALQYYFGAIIFGDY